MIGGTLYFDAAADRADPSALTDVQATPARRGGGRGRWYPQSPAEWDAARAKAFAMTERAIRDGRHSDRVHAVCTFCREWCDGIYFSETGGGGGVAGTKHYCKSCYERMNPKGDPDAPVDAAPAYVRPQPPARRPRATIPTLADVCCLWASVHYREAFEAYARESSWEWEGRVLGAIVRRRAELDPEWLFRVARSYLWEELVLIGDYVKRAAGYPVGDTLTFAQWVRSYRAAVGVGLVT